MSLIEYEAITFDNSERREPAKEYDFSNIPDLIGAFNAADKKAVLKELARREELDKDVFVETVEKKKILKIDWKNRKVLSYTRFVTQSGIIFCRRKEVYPIAIVGYLDDRERPGAMFLCHGWQFTLLKRRNQCIPALVSEDGESIKLPKDYLSRLVKKYPPVEKKAKKIPPRRLPFGRFAV